MWQKAPMTACSSRKMRRGEERIIQSVLNTACMKIEKKVVEEEEKEAPSWQKNIY